MAEIHHHRDHQIEQDGGGTRAISQNVEGLPPVRRPHNLESFFLKRLAERVAASSSTRIKRGHDGRMSRTASSAASSGLRSCRPPCDIDGPELIQESGITSA